ncbi:MAG TPA: class D sortase [Terriglobia bacterium]|nr:class D sortase [Terriglobia bacterium]
MKFSFPKKLNLSGQRSPLLRIVKAVFLIVGLLTLGYCVYVVGEAHFYQTYESWRLDQIRQRRPASTGEFLMNEIASLWNRVTGLNPSGRGKETRTVEGSLVGRVAVPRIGLSSVVLEGDDTKVLQVAVGHIPGTALPGEAGNVALAGHRDTVFRELRAVHKGDTISLTTLQGDYRYRVEAVEVVPPDDTAVLKPTAEPSLTLVTCYPFNYVGAAPWRFVVRAGEIARARAVASAVDTGLTIPIASSLPPTLPGETLVSPTHPAPVHRRRVAARHKSLARRTQRAPEDGLAADDLPSHTREQKARGLASRMRTEWSRLFEHLKDSSSESP